MEEKEQKDPLKNVRRIGVVGTGFTGLSAFAQAMRAQKKKDEPLLILVDPGHEGIETAKLAAKAQIGSSHEALQTDGKIYSQIIINPLKHHHQ